MKMTCVELPDNLNAGGVRIQGIDWGDLNISHIHFPKGADATPLLEGLPQNLCQCPHWGMVLKGAINVRYADGRTETVNAGEVYHWPAGHTVWVDEDYSAIEFSPAVEMAEVVKHLRTKMGVPA
ncbi:hypothetical protein M9M90_11875 [Phenylobacterium sp. LH3H17]|uniref:hypothetical protein n=1 Tax=Phenylobacterium sp. LH3H17 TaxID=2903901 RepID=UPI0020C9D905|nr:hypothetical protein [Phenylobacterium sp. LH3H17]UTP37937.1 hypothetical protein M9M90_11875 [Phenylobacterium sp. LH3H17]